MLNFAVSTHSQLGPLEAQAGEQPKHSPSHDPNRQIQPPSLAIIYLVSLHVIQIARDNSRQWMTAPVGRPG